MFKKWYLSRMQTEIDQREVLLAGTKARAAETPEAQRAEHDALIAAAEGKGRDVRVRLEELRKSGKEHYAELKVTFEVAREGFADAIRRARRFV